jgi:hypothetical protein
MPIWKQRLFSRLQAPADDGADLGGSDSGADTTAQDGAEAADDGAGDEDERQPAPSQLESMLDSMTDGSAPADASGQQGKPDDAAKPNGQEQPASNEKPDDDAEFLASLKSERSRTRFQELSRRATDAETRYQQMEQEVNALRESITSAGMDGQQFAQTIQFAKLANSQNPADLRVARDMLQQQMQAISLRLGEEIPAIDPLAQFPDLKQSVDDFELSKEKAHELARLRHQQAQQQAAMQAQQQSSQQQAMYQQTVQQASQRMDAYLQSRANEIDHKAKMEALHKHFADPAKMQDFVASFQPQQWEQALRLMYDSIAVTQQPPARTQQPLRARAGVLGQPNVSAASPLDRLSQHLDSLNL